MHRKIDWESQIGRRFKLRDLYVLLSVSRRGSMAKAATELGVSQPTVSQVIADLEYALGVRLFDRSRKGVELTVYGAAFLRRTTVAFDELRQGVQEIEVLTDATTGELRIGCPESIATTLVPSIVRSFIRKHPRVIINITNLTTPTLDLPQLHGRTLDMVIARSPTENTDDPAYKNLQIECLFDDDLVMAAGVHSRWKNRRKVDLADLLDDPWILTPPGAAIYNYMIHIFHERGLAPPFIAFGTQSFGLRGDLLATGDYIATIPRSIFNLYAKQFALKMLLVDLPIRPWPIVLVTLKNRTLSPVVKRFIESARSTAKSFAKDGKGGN